MTYMKPEFSQALSYDDRWLMRTRIAVYARNSHDHLEFCPESRTFERTPGTTWLFGDERNHDICSFPLDNLDTACSEQVSGLFAGVPELEQAWQFANHAYGDRRRFFGHVELPAIIAPVKTMRALLDADLADTDILLAAMVGGLLVDGLATKEEIRTMFGETVASIAAGEKSRKTDNIVLATLIVSLHFDRRWKSAQFKRTPEDSAFINSCDLGAAECGMAEPKMRAAYYEARKRFIWATSPIASAEAPLEIMAVLAERIKAAGGVLTLWATLTEDTYETYVGDGLYYHLHSIQDSEASALGKASEMTTCTDNQIGIRGHAQEFVLTLDPDGLPVPVKEWDRKIEVSIGQIARAVADTLSTPERTAHHS